MRIGPNSTAFSCNENRSIFRHPGQTAQQRSDITTNEPHSSSLFLLQERFVLFDHLLDLSLLTAQRSHVVQTYS